MTCINRVIRRVALPQWSAKKLVSKTTISFTFLYFVGIGSFLQAVGGEIPSQPAEEKTNYAQNVSFNPDKSLPVSGFSEPVVTIKLNESEVEKKERLEAERKTRAEIERKRKLSQRQVISRSVSNRIDVPAGTAQELGRALITERFGEHEWTAFYELIRRESGWRVGARNSSSGACGLGQAYPCSKLGSAYGSAEGELRWTINYIAGRYHTPSRALQFHNSKGWY